MCVEVRYLAMSKSILVDYLSLKNDYFFSVCRKGEMAGEKKIIFFAYVLWQCFRLVKSVKDYILHDLKRIKLWKDR